MSWTLPVWKRVQSSKQMASGRGGVPGSEGPGPAGLPPGLGNGSAGTTSQPTERSSVAEPEVEKVNESTQALQRQQADRLQHDGAARAQLLHAKTQGAAQQKLAERLQHSERVSKSVQHISALGSLTAPFQ